MIDVSEVQTKPCIVSLNRLEHARPISTHVWDIVELAAIKLLERGRQDDSVLRMVRARL